MSRLESSFDICFRKVNEHDEAGQFIKYPEVFFGMTIAAGKDGAGVGNRTLVNLSTGVKKWHKQAISDESKVFYTSYLA